MRRDTLRSGLLLTALAVALVAPITLTRGEVTKTGEPDPVPSRERVAPRPVHDGVLRAECWQQGVKIIDQEGLQGLSLNAATRDVSVSFKRTNEDQPSVFLLPFADGLCLIQPVR